MKPLMILIAGIFLLSTGLAAQKNQLAQVQIKTSAVCEMCKKRIEDGLYTQKGVVEANLDLNTKVITIKFRSEKTSEETLRKYISSLGYDADTIVADKAAYDKLPGCCQADGMH